MSKRIVNRTLYAAVVAALSASAASAQQTPTAGSELQEIDTVVITGSIIRGTPVDTALPVETFSMEDLEKQGDPSPLEFVKSLTASGPTTGEAYYFSGSALTNNVQFNLRGIGADKTLTIFNGRQAFQNAAVYPSIVLEKIDVLKDGAAVTYGANATGGVVNMVTRRSFEGFKATSAYKTYKGSEQGEWKLGGMAGFKTDFADIVFAAEWDHRSELDSSERSFSSLHYSVNPAPTSPLTNLASWIPRGTLPTTPAIVPASPQIGSGEWGTPTFGNTADFTQRSCEAVGGSYQPRTALSVLSSQTFDRCVYNYIPYYNLVEENDVYRIYAQLTSKITDDIDFNFRALWARNYSPHQYGSPAQPVIRGPAMTTGATFQLYVPSVNPYAAEFAQRIGFSTSTVPAVQTAFANTRGYTPTTFRPFAHGGNDVFASGNNHSVPNENDTQYWHLTAGSSGQITEAVGFDIAATFNQFVAVNNQPDIHGYRLQNALNGFGGPNCNAVDMDPTRLGIQAVAAGGTDTGVRPAGCLWFNPFATNFAGQPTRGLANPNYIPGAENSDELVSWLYNKREFEDTNYNVTFDAVFSGVAPVSLPGGDIAWGAGYQWRTTKNRETVPDPLYNGMTPCDWPGQNPAATNDPLFTGCTLDRAGPYMFFANNPPDATEQKQQSFFGELNLPIVDSLSMTAAIRYERFMPIDLDATVYKVSTKWQPLDQLSFRGSYGTNYQAPGAGIIPGDIANGVNSYTRAGGAWLGAQTVTRSDIVPETATVWNVGAILQLDFGSDQDLQVILDYFSIETEDELGLVATANDIADSIFSIPGATPTSLRLANCAHPLIDRVTFNSPCVQGTTNAGGFASIRTDFGNGPGQKTTGFDLQINYGFSLLSGRVTLGATVTKLETLESTATILDGYEVKKRDDRIGFLNFATIGQAAPEWKGNFSANYAIGDHNFRVGINYVSGVKDERYIKDDGTIDLGLITPEGWQPDSNVPFGPTYYGVVGDKWLSGDVNYLWRAEWATLGLSVTNVTDRDPPESRQEFGYDPRIGNPLGRQFELTLSKEF